MRRKCRKGKTSRTVVFFACKDSAAKVRALAREIGVDPSDFHILSRKDDPELRTFEDIVEVLPPSTDVVALGDVECLLPPGKRDLAAAKEFLRDLDRRYRHQGFQILATLTDDSVDCMRIECVDD